MKLRPVRWRLVLIMTLIVGAAVWLGVFFGLNPLLRHFTQMVKGKPKKHPLTQGERLKMAWWLSGLGMFATLGMGVSEALR
jgi:hypothetical protein